MIYSLKINYNYIIYNYMTDANSVSYTNNLDNRFLNPFGRGLSKSKSYFGRRYGNVQFIFIICSIISLVLIQLLSNDVNKRLLMISLVLYYIFLYYNLSCYIVPDNHERCFVLAWICIATVIFISILILFHNDIFKKRSVKGGDKRNETNILKTLKNELNKYIGGDNCNKKKKYIGGDNCNKKKKYN